jgi:tetratricopeptide (TPR) repeat protein
MGRCYEDLNDPASALEAYDRLLKSDNADRRTEAAYRHGRALRVLGRYDDALADLRTSDHPGAQGERAAALMGAGRIPEGLQVVDSLEARRDSLAPWEDVLELYAASDPLAASALTMRLAHDSSFHRAQRVDWVVADAERLASLDPNAARGLLVLAESLGGGRSAATRRAEMTLAAAELSQVRTVQDLAPLIDRLSDIQEQGGASALQAHRMLSSAQAVQSALDSAQVERPQSDLRFFLAAELSRDSLRANELSSSILRDMLARWPASPYAPKAALALGLVGSGADDSLRDEVFARQSASPYLLALRGEPAPGFQQLEDSLRIFMARYRTPATRGKAPVRPGAKPTPRDPRDDR